ncbi:unnamed protein product, partial [Prorocentrum cordatum]
AWSGACSDSIVVPDSDDDWSCGCGVCSRLPPPPRCGQRALPALQDIQALRHPADRRGQLRSSRAGGAASAGGQRPQLGGEALPRAVEAGAAGSSAAAPSLGELRAVLGDGSCAFGEPQHGWDEVSHEGVMVRGPRYLTDRAKVNSGPPLLETLCCDTFQ